MPEFLNIDQIKRAITFYRKDSFIIRILELMKENENRQDVPVWTFLLFLKWTLQFGKNSRLSISNDHFNLILQSLNKIENNHELFHFKNYDEFRKTTQLIANQQFYLQLRLWKDSFARNLLLFKILDSNNEFQNKFKNITNVEIEDFIMLFVLLWTYTKQDEIPEKQHRYIGVLQRDFYDIGEFITNKSDLKNFIRILTLNPNIAKKVIDQESKITNEVFQAFETSIFTKYPLFRYNGTLYLLHKNILNTTVNYYFYDLLKSNFDDFTDQFGIVFEKYINIGINELGIPYIPESKLKFNFPNSKYVDFIIDDSILVECKAIELSPLVEVNPKNKILTNYLKTSIIKAYCTQILTVANNLNNTTHKEFWGIILTYKELPWCNGLDCWEEFLKEDALKTDNILIPPENLYFIDIATWDKLVQIMKDLGITLREILENAKKTDSDQKTKKFSFVLHADEYPFSNFNLNYLDSAYSLIDKRLEKLKDD